MKNYKPRKATLEKVLSYLDKQLQMPLSVDDALYARWRIERELMNREVDAIRKKLWDQWCEKYLIKYSNGYYEKGILVKK